MVNHSMCSLGNWVQRFQLPRPEFFKGMDRVVLTPNANEFRRLCDAMGIEGLVKGADSAVCGNVSSNQDSRSLQRLTLSDLAHFLE